MADKKRNILEFVEQSNFEQFTPTQFLNKNKENLKELFDSISISM